jgi:putative photosynthetic complex assembly protein 2
MRVSSKLNVFLGVRNPGVELLPAQLGHLGPYFRRRRMNPLYPVSLLAATALVLLLASASLRADPASFAAAGATLLGTLATLGWLEHALLMLPIPSATLWRWFLGTR